MHTPAEHSSIKRDQVTNAQLIALKVGFGIIGLLAVGRLASWIWQLF